MALQLPPRRGTRKADMMQPTQPTVMLVSSDHLNWVGLRATLRDQPGVTVVGNLRHADRAVSEARCHHPTVLFVAADLPGLSIVALVRALREASPSSKIIVIGEEKTLRHDMLMALGGLRTVAYVLWEDLVDDALLLCLDIVLKTNLVVGSAAVAEEVVAPVERRRRPRDSGLVLDDQQRAVLNRLADGLKEREIAEVERLGLRTVQRIINDLKHKFEVPTTFALVMKVVRLGFIF